MTGIARLCQKRQIVTGAQFVKRRRGDADGDIVRPRIVIIDTARECVVSMPLTLTVGIPSRIVQSQRFHVLPFPGNAHGKHGCIVEQRLGTHAAIQDANPAGAGSFFKFDVQSGLL